MYIQKFLIYFFIFFYQAEAVGRAVKDRVNAYYRENGISEFRDFNIEAIGGESLYG